MLGTLGERGSVEDIPFLRHSGFAFLAFSAVVILVIFCTSLVRVFQHDESESELYDDRYLWYVLCSVAPAIAGSIALVQIVRRQRSRWTIAAWGQCIFYILLSSYIAGGSSYCAVLLPLFAAGPLLGIPKSINLGSMIVTCITLLLLSIDDFLQLGIHRFPTSDNTLMRKTGIVLATFLITTFCIHSYIWLWWTALESRDNHQRVIRDVIKSIKEFKLSEAASTLDERGEHLISESIQQSLRELRNVFLAMTPFLPLSIVDPTKKRLAQDDEDDESIDDHDSKDSLQRLELAAEQEHTSLKRRRCTVLAISINNFPTRNLKDASEVCAIFTETVAEKVHQHDGVVDILSPDYIVATFNCHTPCAIRHPRMACQCALEIAATLTSKTKDNFPDLDWSLAIDTGFNLSGLCGIASKRSEGVSGESVDMAHRLLSLSRQIKCPMLVTEAVQQEVVDSFHLVPVDKIEPEWLQTDRLPQVTIYEIRASLSEKVKKILKQAFQSFQEGNLEDVMEELASIPEAHEHPLLVRLSATCVKQHEASAFDLELPYARREVGWALFPGETSSPENSSTSCYESAHRATDQERQQTEDVAAGTVGLREAFHELAEQQKASAVQVEENDQGLFTMFLPEDEEEPEGDADLGDIIPKEFEDHFHNHWKRSERPIGAGAFSTVFAGLGETGTLIAMKCFKLSDRNIQVDDLQNEVEVLAQLRHPNIVNYVSCALTKAHFILLMELVSGGSLASLLKQFGPMPKPVARRYMHDILKGLQYLHEKTLVHCDLKPHNALLSNEGICKLSDFGSSINTTSVNTTGGETVTVRGTAVYMAPEAARGELSPAIDIWSIGITLIELLSGKLPWRFQGNETQFIYALSKDENMLPSIPEELPKSARELVRQCCSRDPRKRPTVQQVLASPFFSG